MLKKYLFNCAFMRPHFQNMPIGEGLLKSGILTSLAMELGAAVVIPFNHDNLVITWPAAAIGVLGAFRMATVSLTHHWIADIVDFSNYQTDNVYDRLIKKDKIDSMTSAVAAGSYIGDHLALTTICGVCEPIPEIDNPSREFVRICHMAVEAKLIKPEKLPMACRPDPNIIDGVFTVMPDSKTTRDLTIPSMH